MGEETDVKDKVTPNPDDKKVDEKPGDGKVDDKPADEGQPKKEDQKPDRSSVLGGDDKPEKKGEPEPKKEEPKPVDYSGVKLGDESPLAGTDRDEVIKEATELGLTADQAQKLLARRERSIVEYGATLRTQLEKDPELGGDHLEETYRLARRGRDYLFPRGTLGREAMLDLFEHAGVGNHPEWVRAFVRVGRDLEEDKTLDHKEVVDTKKAPLEKRLYKNSQPAA